MLDDRMSYEEIGLTFKAESIDPITKSADARTLLVPGVDRSLYQSQ